MAKRRIIWSQAAKFHRRSILKYWRIRNKSNVYPKKLAFEFRAFSKWLNEIKYKGTPTNSKNICMAYHRDYAVFYEFTEMELIIYAVWDTRRNPENSPFEY
jgi:plasmid stabilization system protein ParE